jgi:Immunity protein 52
MMNEFFYAIWSVRPQHRETPAVIGQKFLDTLDALSTIDPLFTQWKVFDFVTTEAIPLASARQRITAIVENNVARDSYDRPEPKSGYGAIGVTEHAKKSRIVRLTANAGAVYPGSTVLFEIGDLLAPTDPAIVSYPLFRKALLAITAHWQPAWSYACAFRMDYWKAPIVPGAQVIRYSPFHITWIAHLSPELSTGFVVPPSDVRTEHAPGGGLLLSATDETFDPANPEHLRRARLLAETMISHTGDEADDDNPP